ncbi:acyl carrier protein [Streptomyces sp. NPDC056004]|uniref:acyl carrier protein n=1 Tax=unclassified Streptomyces TaxID=2593676 RepID=UPI0035DA2C68
MTSSDIPSRSEVAEVLDRFVRTEGGVTASDSEFGHDVNLFESGYLDSLATVSLISFIEQEFKVELSDSALTSPHFTSITGMSSVIAEELTEARNGNISRSTGISN